MILKPTGTLNLVVTREMQVDNTNNLYVLCQTNAGAVTINLPRISSIAGVPNSTWGFRIFVTDDKNNASVNNITIVPNPADKINGSAAPIVLNTDGATGHLLISGFSSWEFSEGSSVAPAQTQLAVEVSFNPLTYVLTASASGGTPASYLWTIKSSTNAAGEDNLTYTGSTNQSTVQVNQGSNQIMLGMACVTVTDTLGRTSFGYFMLHLNPQN